MSDRKNCVVCNNQTLNKIFTLEKMPVYMGVNKGFDEHFSDMTFLEFSECKTVQIKEIIDTEKIYIGNHNVSIVGNTWENHYNEFSELVKEFIINSVVVEIGDPAFKVSSKISHLCKSWVIVELNPDENMVPPKNTTIIKNYFDENFNINDEIDVIIHSHFLEHSTNITKNLDTTYNLLKDGGKLIFSVPNLESILLNGYSPNNVLHFEHTYFYTEKSLIELLSNSGFNTITTKKYRNHSIFFVCEKTNKTDKKILNESHSLIFKENLNKFTNIIDSINSYIEQEEHKEVFLYGAHISSQFLINIGLKTEKIIYILDNSEDKQGYSLYGTNLFVMSPNIISNYQNPLVIVNHMSVYTEEIKEQLTKINSKTIFL